MPKINGWSGLIKSAWKGYMQNKSILVPSAIPAIMSFILLVLQAGKYSQLITMFGSMGFIVPLFIILAATILVSLYAASASISIVKDSWKKKATLGNAWKTANRKFRSILGAFLLSVMVFLAVYLVGIGIPIVLMIVSAFAKNLAVIIFSLIWAVIGLIAVIAVSILLSFTNYAIIISDTKTFDGLKASWNFVGKNFWSVVALFVIVSIINIPLMLLGFASGLASVFYPEYEIPFLVVQTVAVWLVSPIFLMMFGYFYMQRKK